MWGTEVEVRIHLLVTKSVEPLRQLAERLHRALERASDQRAVGAAEVDEHGHGIEVHVWVADSDAEQFALSFLDAVADSIQLGIGRNTRFYDRALVTSYQLLRSDAQKLEQLRSEQLVTVYGPGGAITGPVVKDDGQATVGRHDITELLGNGWRLEVPAHVTLTR